VNDSFSVNPTSSIVAIDSFEENIILLMGGVDRGLHLENLTKKILETKNLKKIILYGKFGERLARELENADYKNYTFMNSKNFEEIFNKAISFAGLGDVILFSPGAPSFDLFENYIKRGESFNELMEKL
jgi:UDP-N-acetylmuramoylalanine--D-glutamate ligase